MDVDQHRRKCFTLCSYTYKEWGKFTVMIQKILRNPKLFSLWEGFLTLVWYLASQLWFKNYGIVLKSHRGQANNFDIGTILQISILALCSVQLMHLFSIVAEVESLQICLCSVMKNEKPQWEMNGDSVTFKQQLGSLDKIQLSANNQHFSEIFCLLKHLQPNIQPFSKNVFLKIWERKYGWKEISDTV